MNGQLLLLAGVVAAALLGPVESFSQVGRPHGARLGVASKTPSRSAAEHQFSREAEAAIKEASPESMRKNLENSRGEAGGKREQWDSLLEVLEARQADPTIALITTAFVLHGKPRDSLESLFSQMRTDRLNGNPFPIFQLHSARSDDYQAPLGSLVQLSRDQQEKVVTVLVLSLKAIVDKALPGETLLASLAYAYSFSHPDKAADWANAFRKAVDSVIVVTLASEVATAQATDPRTMALAVGSARQGLVGVAASPAASGKLRLSTSKAGQVQSATVSFPSWQLFGLERRLLRHRLINAAPGLELDAPIVFTDLPSHFSTAELLPGRLTARTFDTQVSRSLDHVRNLDQLMSAKIKASTTRMFNFVGPPAGARPSGRWTELRASYDAIAGRYGIAAAGGKAELLRDLDKGGLDVIVVVAHGDQRSIHLPNGDKVTVDDINALPEVTGGRAPLVVLLSCETGRASADGVSSLAQALLAKGRATAVLAPVREVSAGESTTAVLRNFLEAAMAGTMPNFMRNLQGPWQYYVEQGLHRWWRG